MLSISGSRLGGPFLSLCFFLDSSSLLLSESETWLLPSSISSSEPEEIGTTVCLDVCNNLLGIELLFELEDFLVFDCFVDLDGNIVLTVFFIPRLFLFFA